MLFKKNIFLSFLLAVGLFSHGINDSLINRINYSVTVNDGSVNISFSGGKVNNNIEANWLYFNYDHPDLRYNTLSDSGFKVVKQTAFYYMDDSPADKDSHTEIDFKGKAWYKMYFK